MTKKYFNDPIELKNLDGELAKGEGVRIHGAMSDDNKTFHYSIVVSEQVVNGIKEVCNENDLNFHNSIFLTVFANMASMYMSKWPDKIVKVEKSLKLMNYIRGILKARYQIEIPDQLVNEGLKHFKNRG